MTAATGKLSVQLTSDSMFLGRSVPVEVRDSDMCLVQQSMSARQFELPVGLYEVSAVLEDGRRHSALVQVKDGQQTPVELGAEEASPVLESAEEKASTGLPRYERPRYTQKMAAESAVEPVADAAVATQLLDVSGASLLRETRTLWIFECDSTIDAVPTALFQLGEQKLQISLPISPAEPDLPDWKMPCNLCAVKIEETSTGAHAEAWISPERTVANAMQNMLASGYLLHAARVADDAVELLREKYKDPVGAALGALILYKTGRLERWQSWVENLARDFHWLPDGKVILANMLFDDESNRERALNYAVEASGQRMLFTESYSMLLDLLRRWPRDADGEPRYEAMARMASFAPYIDWEIICLSHSLPEEEE